MYSYQPNRTTQKENIAPWAQNHSQGLSMFLTQLAGAYETENKDVIGSAQKTLVGALLTEKEIEKKRVDDKKDAKFVEELERLGLSSKKGKENEGGL